MESNAFNAVALQALGGSATSGATSSVGSSERFAALLQQPPNEIRGNAVSRAADIYVDEVELKGPAMRGAEFAPGLMAAGKELSESIKAGTHTAKLETMRFDEPALEKLRTGALELVKFQNSLTQFTLMFKSVELTGKNFQALYKMQG
jgi:hypothetical protein